MNPLAHKNWNRTISWVVSGVRDVRKSGTGTITLSAANTFTGGVIVAAGTLSSTAHNSSATQSGLGAATNNISIAAGATLELAATGGRTTLMGDISGAGNVTQNNGGTFGVLLGGDNSAFSGTFNSLTGTVGMNFLSENSGSALAQWIFNANSGGVGRASTRWGATADAWAPGLTSGVPVTIKLGSVISTSTVVELANFSSGSVAAAETTFEVGDLGLNETYQGKIVDTGTGSTGLTSSKVNVKKVGTGTLTLTGTNTYTGTTVIDNGALYNGGALGATAVTVNAGDRIGVGSAATKSIGGSLTFADSTSQLDVHTNGTTTASRLNVTGALAAGGCTVNILGALNIGSYILISAGSSSGTLPVLGTNNSGHGVTFTLVAGVLTAIVA